MYSERVDVLGSYRASDLALFFLKYSRWVLRGGARMYSRGHPAFIRTNSGGEIFVSCPSINPWLTIGRHGNLSKTIRGHKEQHAWRHVSSAAVPPFPISGIDGTCGPDQVERAKGGQGVRATLPSLQLSPLLRGCSGEACTLVLTFL